MGVQDDLIGNMFAKKASQSGEEWEKEFDQFYREDGFSTEGETVKSFIKQLLKQTRREAIKHTLQEIHDQINNNINVEKWTNHLMRISLSQPPEGEV